MKRMKIRRAPGSPALVFLAACGSSQDGSSALSGSGGTGLGAGATGGRARAERVGGQASGGSGLGKVTAATAVSGRAVRADVTRRAGRVCRVQAAAPQSDQVAARGAPPGGWRITAAGARSGVLLLREADLVLASEAALPEAAVSAARVAAQEP